MSDDAPKPDGPKQVDGSGQPYITLAQFLKKIQLVGSGGEAKAVARAGEATVNGQPEERPGRKLHAGDRVVIRGAEHVVSLD
jgi:ribosome-associated protein